MWRQFKCMLGFHEWELARERKLGNIGYLYYYRCAHCGKVYCDAILR